MTIHTLPNVCENFINKLLDIPTHFIPHTPDAMSQFLEHHHPTVICNLMDLPVYKQYAQTLQDGTIYHLTDALFIQYCILPIASTRQLLILGPYIAAPISIEVCQQIVSVNQLPSSIVSALNLYHNTLPIAKTSKLIKALTLTDQYLSPEERTVAYVNNDLLDAKSKSEADYVPVDVDTQLMSLLETRYDLENKIHLEILNGNIPGALHCYEVFIEHTKGIIRFHDALQNRKNLSYIANTSFRRTVARAAVHPLYIDMISSGFAKEIENASSVEALDELGKKMVSDYCALVREYSLKSYSLIIQKAMNYIHIHLSTDLSLANIAQAIDVSPNYLSNLFNKEANESITHFIHRKRIEKAAELLLLSYLSIQTIAAYVGYHDMNYFTKLFKKHMGMTPSEYKLTQ